jgi:hypothetical protein
MSFDGDSYCSLGDSRNWTDPITNWTAVSGGHPFRDLKWFMLRGRLPDPLFGPFVHELTHHWCFHSPVGLALAYLHRRASRCADAISGLEDGSEEFQKGVDRILADLTRIEIALKIMRPLAEGLAQFAEFDVLPGDSEVLSEVSLSIFPTFLPVDETLPTERDAILTRLRDLIAKHRFSAKLLDRKKDLLVSPFDCSDGGYLAGYMLVKNLHMMLVHQKKCERLLDKDLTLGFLRCCFYEDYAFVNALLDPEKSGFEAFQAVSLYFQSRLNTLGTATTDETVCAYEKFVLEQQSREPGEREHPQILSPAVEVAAGKKRLDDLRSQIGAAGTPESQFPLEDAWIFAQRSVMCVGRFEDRVEVTKSGMVQAIENPEALNEMMWFALTTGAVPESPEKKGRGAISFFFCFSPVRHRALTIHLDGNLVGIGIFPLDLPEPLQMQFKSYQTDFDRAKDEHLRSREAMARVLEAGGRSEEAAHFRTAIAHLTNEFYAKSSLLYTSDDKLGAARTMLKDDGLLRLLDDDFASIEALAQLSLYNSLSWDRDFLNTCMNAVAVDLSTLLAKLERSKERFGIPLVRDFGPAIYVYV